jgi:RNase H-fold protein (predicted Holliday junction resolvase)
MEGIQTGRPSGQDSSSVSSPIIAVDPGRAKCGIAVVAADGKIHYRAIVPIESLLSLLNNLAAHYHPHALVIGRGTGAATLQETFSVGTFPVPIFWVDERHTSEAARRRYLAENPPRGWRRLIPRSFRFPEQPYDDYVAIILAERWWQKHTCTF